MILRRKAAAFWLAACVLLAGLPCARAATNSTVTLAPEPIYAEIAKRLIRKFPAEHLTRIPVDDAISSRTWTNYLSALDFDHAYFTASDISTLRGRELKLDDELKNGDVSFAYDAFRIFRERVRDRYAFVQRILEEGFDLTKSETYRWRRRDEPWPATQAEMDDLWRRRLKNEYVRWMVSHEMDEDSEQIPEEGGEGEEVAEPTTPEEFISERHRRALTIFEDSDSEWVLERFLTAFAQAYDPHSDYLSPSAVKDFEIEMRLSLVGIGALLRTEDGAAKIVRLIPGGPAHRDKRDIRLRPGDKIIAVAQGDEDPVDVLHWPLHKVVKLIRGEEGTTVALTVIPASDKSGASIKYVDIVRDEVKLEEQAASSHIHTVTGADSVTRRLAVIKLRAFYANMQALSLRDPNFRSSAYDVAKILAQLGGDDIDGVILDLRNNGGGSLLEAVRMTGLFIRTGPTVQVKERFSTRDLRDRDPSVAYEGPLLILVNRLSASASEIVAGALQDYGRAIIVGDSKTHGKGTVQSYLEVGADELLGRTKITSASYFRISGSSTQLRGVIPDIVVRSPFDYMELGEETLKNPIPWSTIKAVRYTPLLDLTDAISELRVRSEQRRGSDSRFRTYAELLERIEKINGTEELPLALEDRRHFHRMEKELSELQEQLAPESELEGEDSETPEVVLDEALHILADFVSLTGGPSPDAARETVDDQRNLAQSIAEWLKKNL